ncbi:MAG: thioredoxin-disulfide reductase [Propionibacteriaceae bacterium]|jgi:thioredoxin reductase (NADPH)|nr:thioredoxin-disulfide reductase [Propionibacteriaceae bacterium]
MTDVRDVVIVGSGPAGYTAAIYAARAGLAPLVLEGAVDAGGALMQTTEIENFPGFPEGVNGPDLMMAMRAQAEKFGAELLRDDAIELRLAGEVKTVVDSSEHEHQARTVILAMGSAYRKLGVPGEDEFTGRGVSYCATCDGFFFRDKDIIVVGGGDTALEEATFLTRFAASVTIVHRRDQLRAQQAMIDRADGDPKIKYAWNSVVTRIQGDQKVASVTLADTVTGAQRDQPVDGVFVAIGAVPRSDLVRGQVELGERDYVAVRHPSTATSLPGVFAAGDLTDPDYRQAITAAASGAKAAKDAERYLEQ